MAKKDDMYARAQRCLIASLLFDDSGVSRVLETITADDIEEPSYNLIFNAIAELSRTNQKVTDISVGKLLQDQGNLKKAGGPSSLFELVTEGERNLLDTSVDVYARIVKEAAAKASINKELKTYSSVFTDDSGVAAADGVSELQGFLNEKLLRLSDESSVTKFNRSFDDYLVTLEERHETSVANAARNHDELQGIPSLLPTLDKYTNGWKPGWLITVGAKTGVGKALALDTPIPTPDGWTTMGELSVGDKVLDRESNPTTVTAATKVMRRRPCYRITFSTGESIVADEQHLWLVRLLGEGLGSEVLTTTGDLYEYIDETTCYITKPMGEGQADVVFLIDDIVEVDSVPVRCIQVDNEDHMYLAGKSKIPTHNSVMAINCATAAAAANNTVMFFSLEMSNEQIIDRVISSTTGIPLTKLKTGMLTDENRQVLSEQLKAMQDMRIIIDTEPKITVDGIRARALKQAQSPEGLDFLIVDYLGLVTPSGRFTSRQEAVADMSRNMKLLAKQLGIPIMVLVQMNRKEEEGLPSLDNIRESGAIGHDSDVVVLMHRDKSTDSVIPHTQMVLAKNRDGQSDKIVRCHSILECSVFREVARASDVAGLVEGSDEDGLDMDMSGDDDLDLGDFDDAELENVELDLDGF